MNIIQAFNQLKEKEINLDLLSEVMELRELCEEHNNYEYYFQCTLLIIDIFISESLLDDALKTTLLAQDMLEDKKNDYQDIYKKLLDNLAYIYITNQNYQRALEVEQMKKDFLDSENCNEVNRWLLECSYIHEAIGEKNDALMKLKAIISNNPTDEDKSVALGNLIKLYVDLNELDLAKDKLDESLVLVNKINDLEGIRYCQYLRGKIARLEKKYSESYAFLQKLIGSIDELNFENFNYLNEFLYLLCDMENYQEGLELINKFYSVASESGDLENRLNFYKLSLRFNLLNNKRKKGFYDYAPLLDLINNLEKEILLNKDIRTTKLRENELLIESESSAKAISKKLVDGLETLNFSQKDSIRNFLLKYSYSLIKKIPMDEIQYFIFDKSVSTVLPVLPTNTNVISSYQYRNNRLYERKINYRDIENSVVLKIIEEQKGFTCDLTKPSNNYIDVITKESFAYNYLYAIPLFNDQGIYGCALYLSKTDYILENFSTLFLKTASSIFESHLVNLLFVLNNRLENQLLSTATNELNYGIFYYSDYSKKMILSDNLAKLLKLNNEVTINTFNSLISQADLNDYSKKYSFINEKKNYAITYHLILDNDVVLFREQASPIEINNNLYYVGTIDKVIVDEVIKEINRDKLLYIDDLKKDLDNRKDKSFTGLVIKSNVSNLKIEDRDDYLYNLFTDLKGQLQTTVYLLDDIFVLLFDNCSLKDVKKKVSKNLIKKYNLKYTLLQYPKLLVRLDDFIGFSKFILKENVINDEIEFTNELYAKYISVCTINSCVNKAIVDESVELLVQHVTLDNQLVGYYITPSIKGVYNDTNVMKVIDEELQYRLDSFIINELENKDFISIYSLSLRSLVNICLNGNLKANSKIVFEIKEFSSPLEINDVIQKLGTTRCRLIIPNELVKAITLNNLVTNGSVILGFNEEIEEVYLTNCKKFINPYYFNINNGLKIGKAVRKISELDI